MGSARDREIEVQRQVRNLLSDAGLSFLEQPRAGGLRPDFLVTREDGSLVVLEIKTWKTTPDNVARAAHQAELYRSATGADRAFVVFPDLPSTGAVEGVVDLRTLASAFQVEPTPTGHYSGAARDLKSLSPAGRRPRRRDRVFCAMPFSADYDDVYFVAMTHAAKSANATCERIDKEEFVGDIVAEILKRIRASVAVIADLSEARPNVLYEVGYVHALGRPIVHISSTPIKDLPFDVSHWNTIKYEKGQTTRLKSGLAKRLRAVLGGKPSTA